ncbi:flagellin [Clostridia bacterium]|nr:flagellin [Clostridia bacterium]
MSAISDVSRQVYSTYQQLSSAKRINSASDDAAGLAISEKIRSQINGLERGTQNTLDMGNLLKTAEGGLSGINDALQRIRELTVQASNGIYGDDDISYMQEEVSQLLDHIDQTSKYTEFNGKKLLKGTTNNLHTASSANGDGMTASTGSFSLDDLGLRGFDLTKLDLGRSEKNPKQDAAFDAIDSALGKVNRQRSKIGAQENRLEYAVNSNETSYINQMQALSNVADANFAKATTRLSTANVLSSYQQFAQQQKMTQQGNFISLLA